ncbi:MAG TPA: Holliday junction branch migration protein RuvA [Cytophagales bacterium]|nr:Holliday junction branch migration protein RuvA [Cytophagales bacterium]
MIAYVEGEIKELDPTFVVMETGGLGYLIKISLNTFSTLKSLKKALVHTHLHIKEDAHTLFGFADKLEKKLFLDLISVNGIGPGTALVLLSSLNPAELQKAIAQEDVRAIQSVKGIGAKTAQLVVLQLKDKVLKENPSLPQQNLGKTQGNKLRDEALQALITLGYTKQVAEKTVDNILKTAQEELSLEQVIKKVLRGI